LNHANRLSRTFTQLLDALNRHRGKRLAESNRRACSCSHRGVRQSLAWSSLRREDIARNRRGRLMQSELPMHLSPRCGARTRSGSLCRSPAMSNGRCRMHGGPSPGAPKGNKNALKHGRYTAEAVWRRRRFSGLIRGMKALWWKGGGYLLFSDIHNNRRMKYQPFRRSGRVSDRRRDPLASPPLADSGTTDQIRRP
jgi:hypothetical protein